MIDVLRTSGRSNRAFGNDWKGADVPFALHNDFHAVDF